MNNSNPSPKMNRFQESASGTTDSKEPMTRKASLGAIFLILFGLFSAAGGLLKLDAAFWQGYVLTGVPILVLTLGLVSLALLRRGKILQGVSLIFAGNLLLPLTASLLQDGLGWAIFVYALTSSAIFLWQITPLALRRRAVGAALLALAFIALMERLNPSIRASAANELAIFFYGASAVLTAAFAIQAAIQARNIIFARLQLKIAFWTGATLAVVSLILIAYSGITARQSAIETAQQEALAYAASQANRVRADAEVPLDMVRALAQALTAAKDPENTYRNLSRSQVNAMLRQVLIENPNFLGVSTLWEPNAFDGQDAFYRGKEGHDLTGRFLPYWVRGDDGNIKVIPLEQYETVGVGDWYILPRLTKREVVIAPLVYPIQGVDTVMATFVAPIVFENKFYGIVGMDAPIAYIQDVVDAVNIYDGKADAFVINSSGKIIGFRNKPEMAGRLISEAIPDYFSGYQVRVAGGQSFVSVSEDGQSLLVFSAINLGRAGSRWSFGLIIPFSEITAPATASALRQGAIGAALTLIGLALLWLLSAQIARPVRDLTAVANAVSQGNFEVAARVKTADETGTLANAFNFMITQLRETFNTLEQRVAERTAQIERRNLDLALAAQVGQSVSQVRGVDDMLKDAAEIIRQSFGLYYVQIYLVNESRTELVLQFGTGEAGAELMRRRHRLPLNMNSINGRAAVTQKSIVIPDTAAAEFFLPNPLLPNTRSEAAVPLLAGDTLVGMLDAQSEQPGHLNEETLLAFEPMAKQIAIAVQNARLVAETQAAHAEVEALLRRLTREGWREYLDGVHKPEKTGFVFEQDRIAPLSGEIPPKEDALVVPISVTGETLGSLTVEIEGKPFIRQSEELLQAVARRVSEHIENLRLLESAERYRAQAEEASRRLTHEGWRDYLAAKAAASRGFIYDLNQVRPYERDEIRQVEERGISLPLKVRGESIGKLIIQDVDQHDEEAVELAGAVAERLSAHIESLRLSLQTEQALAATRRQAQREQALRQITSAVRGSADPAVILRAAARELGSILGRQTVVRLADADGKPKTAGSTTDSSSADGGEA